MTIKEWWKEREEILQNLKGLPDGIDPTEGSPLWKITDRVDTLEKRICVTAAQDLEDLHIKVTFVLELLGENVDPNSRIARQLTSALDADVDRLITGARSQG